MIHSVVRGLWERKVRTLLTLVGVAVCVLALTSGDGMLGYMHAERALDVARFTGRVMLQPRWAGYPPFRGTLRAESILAALSRPDIVAEESTPLLLVVLEPPDNPMDVAGVIGLGVWPGRERPWLDGAQAASGQATLLGGGDDAVILGSQAARFYGASAAGGTITIAGRGWRVVGILKETGVSNVDNLVVMALPTMQAAFGVEGWISAVLLTAPQGGGESLGRALAEEYPALEVNTQEDIRRVLLKKLEFPGKFLGMLSWASFIIVLLIVANIMVIAVRERAQEVELIRQIGERPPAILGYTLVEALLLSLIGGALGVLAAALAASLLGWTWILTWGEMGRVSGLTLAAGLLAGLYPAYRATRTYPEALRYDELRRQMEEMAAAKRAIDQAYRQLVRGREEERERLARELHDQAIQSLVGLKFHLAEKTPDAPAEIQTEIDQLIAMLRELCSDLRPPALEQLGLVAALRSYINDFGSRTGLPVAFRVDGDERRLSPEIELSIFRVAQEALTNVWKHAQAPQAEACLWFGAEGVKLTIRDWGRGFAAPDRLETLAGAGHFGLVNMHERVTLMGGTLSLHSEPGQGTIITVWLP